MTVLLAACNDRFSGFMPENKTEGILVATIAGSGTVGTRAAISPTDRWSYTKFDSRNDVIGFYSLYGNLDGVDGNGPFANARMVYERETSNRSVFGPAGMNYDVALINQDVTKTFVYFPYSDRMEDEGMELRTMVDGVYRCVDALAMSKISISDGGIMSGAFDHTFSEVVILRGYGFDEPREGQDEIKVVTTLPYSHAKVVDNGNSNHDDWKILKPVYNPEYTTLSEQQCREWVAWDGEPYEDASGKRYPAKYAIIPTAISGDRSTVNYVELYDNYGTLHKVTTFGLMSETDKRVSPRERYWLTVRLEGLVPTIYPFAITPWAEETHYTEQRATGINDPDEFMTFVLAYNTYNEKGRSEEWEEALKTFGDRYVKGDDVRWHFHINGDIGSLDVENINIATLCDTLDGRTNTIDKLKSNKAFITELQSGGCIRNLTVTGLNVVANASDEIVGGLVQTMEGGLITGCRVDGYVNATGAAGLAVGQFSAGTISNCSFSGLVVASSSSDAAKGLIGVPPDGGFTAEMLKNVNTSGLLFASTSTGN